MLLQELGLPVQGLGIDTDWGPILLAWEDEHVSLLHRLSGAAGDQSPTRLAELLRRNGEAHAARFTLGALPEGGRRLAIRARLPAADPDARALLFALQGVLARLRTRNAAPPPLEKRVMALRAEAPRARSAAEADVEDALVGLGADWRPVGRGWEVATLAGVVRAGLRQRGRAVLLRLDIARDERPPPPEVMRWMLAASDEGGAWFAARSAQDGATLASAMTMLSTASLDPLTLAWGLDEVTGLAQRW